MTVAWLTVLIRLGKAEMIDKPTYTLSLKWMRPKDIKRRATA